MKRKMIMAMMATIRIVMAMMAILRMIIAMMAMMRMVTTMTATAMMTVTLRTEKSGRDQNVGFAEGERVGLVLAIALPKSP